MWKLEKGWITDLATKDGFLYSVGRYGYDFTTMSLETPQEPVITHRITLPDTQSPLWIRMFEHFAIIDGGRAVYIFGLSDPSKPEMMSTLDFPDYVIDVAFNDGKLFVLWGLAKREVHIFSLADPRVPTHITSIGADNSSAVAASGQYLYLASSGGILRIIDLSQAPEGQEVGTALIHQQGHPTIAERPFALTRVYPKGSILLITLQEFEVVAGGPSAKGMAIVDVSAPHIPRETAWVEKQSSLSFRASVAFIDYLLFANLSGRVQIIDISSPASPMVVGSLAVTTLAGTSVAVHEGFIYLNDWANPVVQNRGIVVLSYE